MRKEHPAHLAFAHLISLHLTSHLTVWLRAVVVPQWLPLSGRVPKTRLKPVRMLQARQDLYANQGLQ